MKQLFSWTYAVPFLAWAFYLFVPTITPGLITVLAVVSLVGGVLAAVHHAEVVAHRVGEPYGTIILAISVTLLEASIIISLMMAGGPGAATYARDTLFAAAMLILNGILGISMLLGAIKYREQNFEIKSVTLGMVGLVSMLVLTFVLPNYTVSVPGPLYSTPQLVVVSVACLVIYGVFLFTQTIRHREYFQPEELSDEEIAIARAEGTHEEEKVVTATEAWASVVLLIACLAVVVFLAKRLSPIIELAMQNAGLPTALVGVAVAIVILLPEAIAAMRAAHKNRFQSSINLALGSALACIGLSIPAVVILCLAMDLPLELGISEKSTILLGLTVFTVMLSLMRGRTNALYAAVLLVNLSIYILTLVYE